MTLDNVSQNTHPAVEWPAQALQTMMMTNCEWLAFVSRRLRRDADLAMRLAASHSADEVWRTCADFWSQAAHDYQSEWATLLRLGSGGQIAGPQDDATPPARTTAGAVRSSRAA